MGEEQAKWYVLHTYAGYESMVKDSLEKLIENNNLQEYIYYVEIPLEQVVEEKNGKRKVVSRKMFPCYVFIKLIYTNNIWFLVTNTRGVTGFVGPAGRPLPLTDEEVKRMRLEKMVISVNFAVNDNVKVISGPLENYFGVIESIDEKTQKAKVVVSMFGRNTPVELDFMQFEKISLN
ncbi:MAG: transcription termination/antitermination protein NusG [Firmicutes bacterium]|nr:transcription termination/antitermination protein NusG [Bacillota bacterium]